VDLPGVMEGGAREKSSCRSIKSGKYTDALKNGVQKNI